MMIKKVSKTVILTVLFTLTISCNKGSGGNDVSNKSTALESTPSTESSTTNTMPQNVSETEEEGLLFMWQEEKLARDVYTKMYEKYKKTIFLNISKSEQQHMDAVKTQLDRKSLAVPVDSDSIGAFKDSELAKLYKELIERGNNSIDDAYRVGLDIELMDIEDLVQRIEVTNDAAIKKVYQTLLNGSYNHKAAFEKMF